MFKVDCPGCKAPYQVDERRVPKTGLKMRCPKCGTSFKVDAPEDQASHEPTPVLGAALGLKGGAEPVRPRPQQSRAAAAGLKSTMLGVAAPAGVLDAKKKPPLPKRDKPALPSRDKPPLPGREKPPLPTRAKPPAAPVGGDPYSEADLPMLGTAHGGAAGADLPAVPRPKADLPAVPRPKADLPAVPQRKPDSVSGIELDLPASSTGVDADLPAVSGELDLPTVSGAAMAAGLPAVPSADAGAGLPAVPSRTDDAGLPAVASPSAPDLPLVDPSRDASGALELDLPTVGGSPAELPSPRHSAEFELDADLPAPSADLPSPAGGGANVPLLSLDSVVPGPSDAANQAVGLPSPSADLPLPSAGLPSPSARLPSPSAGLPSPSAGLPSPSAGLPSPSAVLPSPAGTTLPTPAGALPTPAGTLPTVQGFGADAGEHEAGEIQSFSLPPENALDLDAPRPGGDAGHPSGGFGELDLGDAGGLAQGPDSSGGEFDFGGGGEAEFGGAGASEAAEVTRSAGGGVAFGEVNLTEGDGGGGEVALEDAPEPPRAPSGAMAPSPSAEEDMEFGAIPQEDQAAGGITAGAEQVQMRVGAVAPKKTKTGVKVAVGVVALVCIGGGALAMLPEVGPFGYYVVTDAIKAGDYQRVVADAVRDSRRTMAEDTFPSAQVAVKRIELLQTENPRVRPLVAYSAFLGLARELRFGANAESHARAKVFLDGLAEQEGQVEYEKQARAALAAVEGKLAAARRDLTALRRAEPKNIDVLVVLGELELKAKDAKAARAAWEAAHKLEKSARTTFGRARALSLLGDVEEAEKAARQAIQQEPKHSGAKLLVARIIADDRKREDEALELVQSVLQNAKNASKHENVTAQTLLGDIHLRRSRIGAAEKAYTEALKIDPKAAEALQGLGAALYASARYSEALARYEAGIQANPKNLETKLGVIKSKLALERVKEAASLAGEVAAAFPKSSEAAYWQGRVHEANGDREQAEAAYRNAVKLAGTDESAVDSYVSLATVLLQKGDTEEAQTLLDKARKDLPVSPAIHKALGALALAQGRYDAALEEFDAALKLDPDDLRAQFQRGVALRRARRFDDALAAFESVAKQDKDFPGLALERGLLYEASGRAEEALKEYEAALAKAPDDPDLMLRVGCSNVSAGRGKEAEKLLKKVLQQRPNSAETSHCLGRAQLLDGTRLAEALKNLQRAVAIDPHRPEYHLYVGWAANEARNFKLSHRALEKALSLDQSMADAYWQRGLLLARQGAVKDAIQDLKKALDLRPTRYEAHAALADSYYDLGREAQALEHWRIAVANIPDRPEWRFRYGKLLAANRQMQLAKVNLKEAIKIVDDRGESPRWLPQAHLLLAQAMGLTKESIEHWEGFLKGAQQESPYRAEAIKALRKLGKPWTGD